MAARMQDELDSGNPARIPLVDAWRKSSPPVSTRKLDGEGSPTSRGSVSSPAKKPCLDPTDPADRRKKQRRTAPRADVAAPTAYATSGSPVEPSAAKPDAPPWSRPIGGDKRRPVAAADCGALVNEIVSMGFAEDYTRRCLKDAGWDTATAASMLLSEAFG